MKHLQTGLGKRSRWVFFAALYVSSEGVKLRATWRSLLINIIIVEKKNVYRRWCDTIASFVFQSEADKSRPGFGSMRYPKTLTRSDRLFLTPCTEKTVKNTLERVWNIANVVFLVTKEKKMKAKESKLNARVAEQKYITIE